MKIRTSEVFRSFQGEGICTGAATVWVRLFGCNLNCNGFGQKNPTDPSTYILPYQTFDAKSIKKLEDLPVFTHGCDSSYSWNAKYKHLAKDWDEETLATEIERLLPGGTFEQPNGNCYDLCFTGGEPMMQQKAMIAVVSRLRERRNPPKTIQIETNGTKPLTQDFIKCVASGVFCERLVLNISPKLYTVSGEKDAVKYDTICSYADLNPPELLVGLKFVVNGTPECWEELETHTRELRKRNFHWPIYVMPVGATLEQQNDESIARICDEALERGYHISTRAHVYVYGNKIGS